jgi:rare lipoprotein A
MRRFFFRAAAAPLLFAAAVFLSGCTAPVRVPPKAEEPSAKASEPPRVSVPPAKPPEAPDLAPWQPLPQQIQQNLVEEGVASWYGADFHGRRTANGEVYDMHKYTAAHRTLPFDTLVKVTNLDNGQSTVVRVNDRGPFAKGRVIDLSYASAKSVNMVGPGTARVRLEPFALGGEHRFVVQAGSFSVRENAERFRTELLGDFPQSFVMENEGFWRVRLGPFGNEDEARRVLDRLRIRGHDGFVATDGK